MSRRGSRVRDFSVLRSREASGLLAPAILVFAALLVAPLAFLFRMSLLPSMPAAPLDGPLGLGGYLEILDPYFLGILWRTLRIAGLTTAGCLLLGYPVALSIARSRGWWRAVQMGLVITPLFVSVVVRAYGWVLLLGRRGPVNGLLTVSGLREAPVRLLNTETAVVVGLVEALLPFMVLSLEAVIRRIDPALEEAARGLGASALGAFWRVTLPLSAPGAATGSMLVFMVATGSYATPALLGGSQVRMMVTEIYTQITAVFNWPLGAVLALGLLAVSLACVGGAMRLAAASRAPGVT